MRTIALLDLLRQVGNLCSGPRNWNPSEEKRDGSLISADQKRIRIVGTFIERLSEIIGRR
jgi:hypothetical protein